MGPTWRTRRPPGVLLVLNGRDGAWSGRAPVGPRTGQAGDLYPEQSLFLRTPARHPASDEPLLVGPPPQATPARRGRVVLSQGGDRTVPTPTVLARSGPHPPRPLSRVGGPRKGRRRVARAVQVGAPFSRSVARRMALAEGEARTSPRLGTEARQAIAAQVARALSCPDHRRAPDRFAKR